MLSIKQALHLVQKPLSMSLPIFKMLPLLICLLWSCSQTNQLHYASDPSFVMISEEIAPNKQFKIIHYQFDICNYRLTPVFCAVVPNDDKKRNLYEYQVPIGYRAVEWSQASKLVLQKEWEQCGKCRAMDLRSGDLALGVELVVYPIENELAENKQ